MRGNTGLPGRGTRLGESGEEVRGVRTVVTGDEGEGRMTWEGAVGVGVRGRPRGDRGGGAGADLGTGGRVGEGVGRLGVCMRMVSCSVLNCFLRCR